MTLGEKIKFVRQKQKMSQAELADAAKIYQKNISRYELDGTVPSALVLKQMADVLGVSTDFLLNGKEEDFSIVDKDLAHKFAELQNMTGKTKEMALEFLDLLIRDFKTKQTYSS